MLICSFFRNHRLYLAATVTETKSTLPLILQPPRCSAANVDAYRVTDSNRQEYLLPGFTVKDQACFALLHRARQSCSPAASNPPDRLPRPPARPRRAQPPQKAKPARAGGRRGQLGWKGGDAWELGTAVDLALPPAPGCCGTLDLFKVLCKHGLINPLNHPRTQYYY